MILVEQGPGARPALFSGARDIVVAHTAADVAPALARLDALRARGLWVAGTMAYEAGYALEPALAALMPPSHGPLMVFGAYDGPGPADAVLAQAQSLADSVSLSAPTPTISRAEYAAAFASVMDYIGAGDCYQINLTFPMMAHLTGPALGLYGALRRRQSVGYGAFVDLGPDLGVGSVLISRSPELFLRTDATGRVETRPMKGTAPRDPDPVRDAELAEDLRASAKGQAENLMIVDLLRNDISRICRVGSVKVPELFAVETYATLHQMVSRVTGQLLDPPAMATIFPALFPCGSITGAPKIRAMQIIHQVEPAPRAAYCGSIGWMAPDGTSVFNVAIRTLQIGMDGRVDLNVGGGVVHDSTEDGEWEEALWKARYATGLTRRG